MSGTAEHSFKSRPPKNTKILLIGPRTIENHIYNEGSQYVWVIDQVWGQDGWILAKLLFFFFCVFDSSRSINSQKKERGQYPAILTEQTWSIKDLLYGFWGTNNLVKSHGDNFKSLKIHESASAQQFEMKLKEDVKIVISCSSLITVLTVENICCRPFRYKYRSHKYIWFLYFMVNLTTREFETSNISGESSGSIRRAIDS